MSNAQSCAEKIFVNLNSPPAFQLRQKVLGDNNANLTYIINETKASVTLRGRGSGYIEQNGTEANDPLHLLIEHPVLKNLIDAKNYAKNLIETIHSDLQMFLQSNQQTVQIQQQQQPQPPPIIQTSTQQITIPQAVLSCPPPTIIQNNNLQPTHIIQQQNFIPQHQIIPQMQIIQQTPINIPPPNAIRTSAPIVQFQGQTASLQPTNIQIQGANGQQQILHLNQAPTQQYQLQYIPSTNQITGAPQMQTIQHVIQPQQQIQGILQPGANGQQFITVQGNTAFMIPPPNIIQQNQPQAIFNAPPTISLNPDDTKNEAVKMKQDGSHDQKNNQNLQQMATRIVTNIPINQPPPTLTCPPPQIFNQQQGPQHQIQQFIVNTNGWPQQQQLQQLPMNSQIQIVAQPQTIRSGNEIVIQNPGQQVITTFNPQQGGQQFQQIQFHQATITQPPPPTQMHNIQSNHQNISFQQQFEQKINSHDVQQQQQQQQQQRAGKRKFEGETETEQNKMFPKMGMGQNLGEHSSSPKTKSRMMTSNLQVNQLPVKLNVNNAAGPGGDNPGKINNQSKPMFNRNINATLTNASAGQKSVTTTVESKMSKSLVKIENESSDANELGQVTQFSVQSQPNQSGFMMRSGNQNFRFQGPQNFIHQQPPPMSQASQFGPRGQIMSNSSMNLYQNVGQSQMMQPPPPVTTTASHHYIQQDMNVYQQNNNFHANSQQVNMSRFNVPQQQQQQQSMPAMGGEGNSGMMTGNYQQQPRFRQW